MPPHQEQDQVQDSAEKMQVDIVKEEPKMPKFRTRAAEIVWQMRTLADEAFLTLDLIFISARARGARLAEG